ncbi:hypothetical protein L228DRAFT_264447 [Xylona heveae TC161]|uniref:Uncharacterized protein n=1 Tax=Xylona heveae (strain CBS 132557 / TC161) TaxID=1328760 RepID=A0A165JBI8_XYLHT|nr:hypothetical protein L228DRAFT_264447 [Xylona heveae TC161]KZF26013.1 hypothetical protein L228DRAFT_264447 [Xylona heveae TC161]
MEDPFVSRDLNLATLPSKLKFAPLGRRIAVSNLVQASFPGNQQSPKSFQQWKTVLVTIKELLLNRKFRECFTRCLNLLQSVRDQQSSYIHPIQESALNYYAALCCELLARPLHILSADRLRRLESAREHYLKASDILPGLDAEDTCCSSSATFSSPKKLLRSIDTNVANFSKSRNGVDFPASSPRRLHSDSVASSVASFSSLDAIFNSPPFKGASSASAHFSPLPFKPQVHHYTYNDGHNKENSMPSFDKDSYEEEDDSDTDVHDPFGGLKPSPLSIRKVDNQNNNHSHTCNRNPLVPSPLRPKLKPILQPTKEHSKRASVSSLGPAPSPPKRASVTFTEESTAWLRMRSRHRFNSHLTSFAEMLHRHIDAVEELVEATTKAQAIHRETQARCRIYSESKKTDKESRIARLRAVGWQRPRFDAERYQRLCQAVLEEL